jgi:hypothetical protein
MELQDLDPEILGSDFKPDLIPGIEKRPGLTGLVLSLISPPIFYLLSISKREKLYEGSPLNLQVNVKLNVTTA